VSVTVEPENCAVSPSGSPEYTGVPWTQIPEYAGELNVIVTGVMVCPTMLVIVELGEIV